MEPTFSFQRLRGRKGRWGAARNHGLEVEVKGEPCGSLRTFQLHQHLSPSVPSPGAHLNNPCFLTLGKLAWKILCRYNLDLKKIHMCARVLKPHLILPFGPDF